MDPIKKHYGLDRGKTNGDKSGTRNPRGCSVPPTKSSILLSFLLKFDLFPLASIFFFGPQFLKESEERRERKQESLRSREFKSTGNIVFECIFPSLISRRSSWKKAQRESQMDIPFSFLFFFVHRFECFENTFNFAGGERREETFFEVFICAVGMLLLPYPGH